MRKFLIAGGNTTALVWNCPPENRVAFAKQYLQEVEQVGFVYSEQGVPKLMMMGEELCVDALLALAAASPDSKGTLLAYSIQGPISYARLDPDIGITLKLPFTRPQDDTVLFDRMGYLVTETRKHPRISKGLAADLARTYKLPAFGIIRHDNQQEILLHVYVAETDSFVEETCSGSGSIATSIVTGWERIIQPTGYVIAVHRTPTHVTVEANVMPVS
jgi:hypothetical protein